MSTDFANLPWRKTADDVPITRADPKFIPEVLRVMIDGGLNDEVALEVTGKPDAAEGKEWRDTFRSIGVIGYDAEVVPEFRELRNSDDNTIVEAFAYGFNFVPEAHMSRDDRTAEWVQANLVVNEDMHTAAEQARNIVEKAGLDTPIGDLHAWERDTRFTTSFDTPGGRLPHETQCPWCFITIPKSSIGDYGVCPECESGIAPIGDSTRETISGKVIPLF